jgi:hypothetical protein
MTEQKNRRDWTPDEEVKHHLELAEQRAQWERNRAAEAEQKRVAALRREMEAYKEERMRDWMEHGGDPAGFSQVWPQMMKDYLDGKHLEREIEREAKLGEAEENYAW